MTPVKFAEVNCVYGKYQSEYLPLPVYKESDGQVTSCWKLTIFERLRMCLTGRVWLQMLTFNNPLQPIKIMAEKPLELNTNATVSGDEYPCGE
jgi:hypothetical protein